MGSLPCRLSYRDLDRRKPMAIRIRFSIPEPNWFLLPWASIMIKPRIWILPSNEWSYFCLIPMTGLYCSPDWLYNLHDGDLAHGNGKEWDRQWVKNLNWNVDLLNSPGMGVLCSSSIEYPLINQVIFRWISLESKAATVSYEIHGKM